MFSMDYEMSDLMSNGETFSSGLPYRAFDKNSPRRLIVAAQECSIKGVAIDFYDGELKFLSKHLQVHLWWEL
jgi:hypothetical protein